MTILNFSQDISDAQPPAPLPPGPYPAEIISAEARTSPTSGKQYANILFRVNPEAYPADYTEGDEGGTVLSYNRLAMEDTPRSRYAWRQFLERVGGTPNRSVDLNSLIGLTGTIDVTHQEYQGEQRASIARVLSP